MPTLCIWPRSIGDGRRRASQASTINEDGEVEAISLNAVDVSYEQMQWIGINQNRANRFIERFMLDGHMNALLHKADHADWRPTRVQRECTVATSKLDFVVDEQIYVEVKTPLIHLPCHDHPNYRENKKPLANAERLVKHFGELANLRKHRPDSSARLLLCFMYNAPPFRRPPATAQNKTITDAAQAALLAGVELWQNDATYYVMILMMNVYVGVLTY
ncbi:hypothetical protein SYNPS1DRAFT_27715 [Syncephalis pseudoplumigaleata]|uniref:Sugar fermentation stimulation protein C-terminal domain-containing protein n=1 Tax=Syncephalis pseudoplumigaleata TaxID=1712513 RepID=A0A4P9Z260_9FUNG|nr:hypothetical protein SYNPS1DRAFT_27715 [Syncephalis pseudoplumigaleata]|eukprot:RKP26607.1 hypothetical protein SYNPS1DRAFT_27715 [Syncephalis pseudoplumigaleata]